MIENASLTLSYLHMIWWSWRKLIFLTSQPRIKIHLKPINYDRINLDEEEKKFGSLIEEDLWYTWHVSNNERFIVNSINIFITYYNT